MYKNKTITVCLPCRNEGSHLAQVIATIPDYVDEIIVVSNKSTDDTVSVAKSLSKIRNIKVFEDDRTLNGVGIGFAYQTAMHHTSGDIIVGGDADGTYPFEKIGEMIDFMEAKNVNFVSGSRYPMDKNTDPIPFMLKLGVWVLNMEILFLYGKKVNDSLSGMWCFEKKLVPILNLEKGQVIGDWNSCPQMRISAFTNPNINAAEFHITQKSRLGKTKQSYWKTGMGHLIWIFLHRFGINRSSKMDATFQPVDFSSPVSEK